MTAWTAAHQASLSIANAWSLLKPMSVESVMSSNHLILYHPFLLLPSIFPSIRVFSNEAVLYHLAKVLMGRAMFGKSLTQFSTDGRGCVPSLLFDLRPNSGGGNEDNGNLLQKDLCTHCFIQCPLTLQQGTLNSHCCQRLLDTHRQV